MTEKPLVPRSRPGHPAASRPDADSLHTLYQQISHLLDVMYEKIGKHHHPVSGQVFTGFSPETDVSESDEGFHIVMELPGLEEKDIEISITEDLLTISGEKRTEKEVSEADYHLRERAYGSFQRRFRLPPELDTERAEAHYQDGVLTIDISRAPGSRSQVRKIPVRSR
ncbi:MAG: Hsp20/alpha crystallin family protein [Kiloniellales bacterium]|nr:Hsp20/alpha crystallin family protein [Kiloniellales bacterium]